MLLEQHSDEGRNFEYKFFRTVCDRLGIRKTRTIELYSQFNEMVEWVKRIIGNYLSEVICYPRERLKQRCFVLLKGNRSTVNQLTRQILAKNIIW